MVPMRINTAKCKLSFAPQNNHEAVSPRCFVFQIANPELAVTTRSEGPLGLLTLVCGVSPVHLEACEKRPVIAFHQCPSRRFQHRLKTWAGLGKVPQLLAPTCASRLTRMRPVADPRGRGGPNTSYKGGGRDASRDDCSLSIAPLCLALLLGPRLLASPARPPCCMA